jgi:tetratricopeptide (TPR) repeat protein
MMNNPLMGSAHRDVLEAPTPSTPEKKNQLVEELQSRGRAAVGAQSWMDAKLLYEKAIGLCPAADKLALFHANLSLVLRTMGDMEASRVSAVASVEADPVYVKGWWRLGQALQALKRPQEALEALEKAKSLEPTNKALVKECEKVQKQVEEEKKLLDMQVDSENEGPSPPMNEKAQALPKPTKTTAHSTSSTTTSNTTTPSATTEDETNIFSKSDAVRGYKTVNGKKTSYFHNELSEEAKNLIGDIAPQKLDPSTATTAATDAPTKAGAAAAGTSAWNKAGTWEERNVTKWAQGALEEKLLQTTFSLPESSPTPGALVSVSKVVKLEGHASVAMARGKKRYIYEFSAQLEWTMAAQNMDCRGKLTIPDIDGTIELGEGYEQDGFEVSQASDASVRPVLERFVQRGGFRNALNESIDDWVRLLKETY